MSTNSFSLILWFMICCPLAIIGLGFDERISPTVKLVIASFSLIPILGIVILLGQDIGKSTSESYKATRYFIPLRDELKRYIEHDKDHVTFSYDLVNQILNDRKEISLSEHSVKLLEDYRNITKESNLTSNIIISRFAEEFQSSSILQNNRGKITDGRETRSIIELLNAKAREDFLKDLEPGINISFEANHGRITHELIILRLPKENSKFNEVKDEVSRIFNLIEESPECMQFAKVRTMLYERQSKLFESVETQIPLK